MSDPYFWKPANPWHMTAAMAIFRFFGWMERYEKPLADSYYNRRFLESGRRAW